MANTTVSTNNSMVYLYVSQPLHTFPEFVLHVPIDEITQMWWRAVCGGKRAAEILHSHGCNTIGKLYTYVHGSAAAFSSSSSTGRSRGSGRFTRKIRARTKMLRRLLKDDDLAVKISSLLLRLMSAFEELRVSLA